MNIAILIYEGLTALDAIGPYEVLCRMPNARVHFVGRELGSIRTDSDFLSLNIETTIADLPAPDILLVPGSSGGFLHVMQQPDVIDWVKQAHQTSQWTTSVCTGAYILGAAGVLDGKPATTHWRSVDGLAQFGAVCSHERIVWDGKLITAAGVSAGIDMALFLVEQVAGKTIAQQIQLAIEYDPSPPHPMVDRFDKNSDVVQGSTLLLGNNFNDWMKAHPLEN